REIISEFPYILKGEFQRYFPKYFRDPLCAIRAKLSLFAMLPLARRCYRESAARFPDGARGRREFYRLSRELLRRR
ncbi:hypothetical protein HYR69_08170, partial [Candidatus Sumerlaeota bacterium]|nr:hypothetical protein [Candidatus Sumerlaeota bacterium]